MIIAQKKRKENIIEYLLYMWQIEDVIRAHRFDIDQLYDQLIKNYRANEAQKEEIKAWFNRLIEMMKEEGVQEKGHIFMIRHIITELNDLHQQLLQKDVPYKQAFQKVQPHIQVLRDKNPDTTKSDLELLLTALYGVVLIRLQKKKIQQATQQSVKEVSNFLSELGRRFHAYEKGELEL